MEDHDLDHALPAPPHKRFLARLIQHIRPAEPLPAPFHESDFVEQGEWRWSTLDAQPGAAE